MLEAKWGILRLVSYIYNTCAVLLSFLQFTVNAASKGYMSIVEFLLDEAHANPLIKNNFGEAAYDVSAAAGESYICEMLEKAGRRWWHLQHTEGEKAKFEF